MALKTHYNPPRLIALEVTRSCPLACLHCRAGAADKSYTDELSLEEIQKILSSIASFTPSPLRLRSGQAPPSPPHLNPPPQGGRNYRGGEGVARPVIILTGGEPLERKDIFDIASHGSSLGLHMVMATCGQNINGETVERLKGSGIRRLSFSIDGPTAEAHDKFRGVEGSFDQAVAAARLSFEHDLPFQINTTVTKKNMDEIDGLINLAIRLGAAAFHPFFLVPTGRAKGLSGFEMDSIDYERVLGHICELDRKGAVDIKVTCAPQYHRIAGKKSRGCLAGTDFAFISHTGRVQTCGFLDISCGELRNAGYNFEKIWKESEIFNKLRDRTNYIGKCGYCNYHEACGGCRARAFEISGDYLAEEPYCAYFPSPRPSPPHLNPPPQGGRNYRRGGEDELIKMLQNNFPLVRRPFKCIADLLGMEEKEVIERVKDLKKSGIIRRIGPTFNPQALGFKSTLIALKVPGDKEDRVANFINSHNQVTHNYKREGPYDIWFTFIYKTTSELTDLIEGLKSEYGVENILELPSTKRYKLQQIGSESKMPPLGSGPKSGILKSIRRFGAVVDHNKMGYIYNALLAWRLPEDKIDEAGAAVSESPAVSHCYRREPAEGWPYNLYAMAHAKSENEFETLTEHLKSAVDKIVPENDFARLKTLKEYKKTGFNAPCFQWPLWPG